MTTKRQRLEAREKRKQDNIGRPHEYDTCVGGCDNSGFYYRCNLCGEYYNEYETHECTGSKGKKSRKLLHKIMKGK